MVAWAIWSSRNKLVFENKVENAKEIVSWANRLLGDFLMSNELDEAKVPRVKPSPTLWCPPLSDSVKINVDVAVNQAMEYIGIGIVARDCNGTVLAATV